MKNENVIKNEVATVSRRGQETLKRTGNAILKRKKAIDISTPVKKKTKKKLVNLYIKDTIENEHKLLKQIYIKKLKNTTIILCVIATM